MPEALLSERARLKLERVADRLPATPIGGLECRLDARDERVDVQLGGPPGDAVVQRLLRRDARPLAERVSQLWFEFDLAGPGHLPAASVFALVRGEQRPESAAELVLALGVAPPSAALDRVVAAAPREARLAHVAIMRGRPGDPVRVGIDAIRLHDLARFLDEAGWPGDGASDIVALARGVLDRADAVVVTLDLADGRLLPGLGLECFFHRRELLDPRWPGLLEHLVAGGLADAAKARALLSWPGSVTPGDAQTWPDDLIVRDLGEPDLAVVERRVNHVKLTWSSGAVETKAYFGWGLVRRGAVPAAPRPSRAPRPARDVPATLERGIAFLLAARNQAGWWRDFFDRARPPEADRRVTGYASDEWVTAYVANELAATTFPEAQEAAADALELLLLRPRPGPGWGYHALLPADADTTTWVLRLARRLGRDHPRLPGALAFVRALTGSDGGVATYPPAAAEQLAAFLGMPGPYDGWSAPHLDVTAAAAVLPELGPAPRAYLATRQRADGSWTGHWWHDDEYATARAVEVLGGTEAADRARRWALARLEEDRSPFATALALRAAGPDNRGVARLLRTQRDDGSWEPCARLRVPAPEAVDPLRDPSTTLTYVDDDALFTTATVVGALAAA